MYDKEKATWNGVRIKNLNLTSMSAEDRSNLLEAVFEAHEADNAGNVEYNLLASVFTLQDSREADPIDWSDGIGEIEGKEGLHAWVSGSWQPNGQMIPDRFLSIDIHSEVRSVERSAEHFPSRYKDRSDIERYWSYGIVVERIKHGMEMAKWFRIYADRLDKVLPAAEKHLASLKTAGH